MQILNSNFPTMVDLFKSAQELIMISSPGISEVVAEALISSQNEDGIKVKVYLEFTEKSFRHGFGEINAITKLRENNIEIFSNEGMNLYFIIVDYSGYFYFPKSLFVEEEGTASDLFPMTEQQVKTIKLLYNNLDKNDLEFESIIEEIGIVTLQDVSKKITPILKESSILLEEKINNDLPVKPNYERKLNVYKAEFQFVELKFSGAKLHTKKVKLPWRSLPFKDATLKKTIEANLRILDDISEKTFLKPFFDLINDLDSIRKKYFYYLKTRDKNIIKRADKSILIDEINSICNRIEDVKLSIINQLQKEIQNSRNRVKNNLLAFFLENKPEEFEELTDEDVLKSEIENYCSKIISTIHFPRAISLLNVLKLDLHFYDITWQDLNNKEVLDEMLKHNLLKASDKLYFEELAIATDKNI